MILGAFGRSEAKPPLATFAPTISARLSSDPMKSLRRGVAIAFRHESLPAHKFYLLTPAHVAAGADNFWIDSLGTTFYVTWDVRNLRLVAASPTYDLALLEGEGLSRFPYELIDWKRLRELAIPDVRKSGGIVPFGGAEFVLAPLWKFFRQDREWPFVRRQSAEESPIYPFSEWIDIPSMDLRPGRSGDLLVRNLDEREVPDPEEDFAWVKRNAFVGIFTKLQMHSRSGVGIPLDLAVPVVESLMRGVDPWRKRNPGHPYLRYSYVPKQGWRKDLVVPAGFGVTQTLTLTETCVTSGYRAANGGSDWLDGTGTRRAANRFTAFFVNGASFAPERRCQGKIGILANGELVTGFRQGAQIQSLNRFEQLNLARRDAAAFAKFWRSRIVWKTP